MPQAAGGGTTAGQETTENPQETTLIPPTIQCTFETDFCGFEISGTVNFHFTREQAGNITNAGDGPTTDQMGSKNGHFLYIFSGNNEERDQAEMETHMIHGANHEIECFHFWFVIKKDGSLRSIALVQQDEEQEDHAGDIELLWMYTNEQVKSDEWLEGQVEVRAHYYQEISQNYTLRFVAEDSKENSIGWAAIDSIELKRGDGCMDMPHDAIPSTPGPTQSTTVPPQDDVFCTFQEDNCGFEIDGDGDFQFARTSGSQAEAIGTDHHGNAEGKFLYAESGDREPSSVFTYVISTEFQGDKHKVECFHFWFYLDGFLDGAKNESLQLILRYDYENMNDSLVWKYESSTPEWWTEGQVELRSVMVAEKWVNWKINVMAVKPGDMSAFIAVDDFAFHISDICETMPQAAGGGTTAGQETTENPKCTELEVTCGDGTCLSPTKRCNFKFDCPNDTADEDNCPQFYSFENCGTVEKCHWNHMFSEHMEWVITSGSELANTGSTTGPFIDFNNKSSGHFLYIQAEKDNSSPAFAQISTNIYQNSASECFFNFYVYLDSGTPSNYPNIIPKLSHKELGYITILDNIDLVFVKGGVWTKIEIGIGRHRDMFAIILSLENTGLQFAAGVAIDEVNFFECAPPPEQEECLDDQFHCELTKACISNTKLCDLQDDCGDSSDEVHGCELYRSTDFEVPDQPLGFFTQGEDGFDPGDFTWQRGNGTTNNKGSGPPFDHTTFGPDGHYLYIQSELALPGDYAWLWSPVIVPSTRECRIRFFSHMHGLGVGNLTVFSRSSDGSLTSLKHINGFDQRDVNKWQRQDIELPSDQQFHVIIEATVGWSGCSDIAIDDVSFTPECKFLDQESTTAASSTEHPTSTIECNFEDGFCGFEVSGIETFNFTINSGEDISIYDDGPATDENGSKTGKFVYVSAADINAELAQTEIETYMIHGADHLLECFHFWFTIKKDGSVRSIAIVQQDEEQEDHAGDIELLWMYTSEQVDSDEWIEGEVEVRVHYYQDKPQNFTLRIVAEHGKLETKGWAAIDQFVLRRTDDCMLKPHAAIPSTPAPTQSTTVPSENGVLCTFQKDKCGFEIEGNGDFKFSRKSGSQVQVPASDHLGHSDGMFLYAQSSGSESDILFTSVKSTEFEGDKHIVECFHFWFYLNGFQDGNKNESLGVILEYNEESGESLVWSFSSPTPAWTEGQIELRSVMVDEKWVNWKINVKAFKPGDMSALAAVDDFAFHVSDICETIPSSAAVGTTTSTSTDTTKTTSKTTNKTTSKTTTRTTTKRTTTEHEPGTTQGVTASPSNPHKHTATIVGVVVGVLILLAVVVAVVITVRRRNIQIPGLRAIQGFLNPNYRRMDESGVSLRDLSSREQS